MPAAALPGTGTHMELPRGAGKGQQIYSENQVTTTKHSLLKPSGELTTCISFTREESQLRDLSWSRSQS